MPNQTKIQPIEEAPEQTEHVEQTSVFINTKEGVAIVGQNIEEAIADNDRSYILDTLEGIDHLLKEKYPHLQEEQPELYSTLQRHLVQARWYILNALSPKVIERLFAEHFEHFFEYDWQETLNNIKITLRGLVPVWEDRDQWKARFRQAIAGSQVHIGTKRMRIAEQEAEPKIANWLKDWKEFLGEQKTDPLLIVEYLNKNPNAQQLESEDRVKLEHLLKFDHALSLSSLTAEGTEEQMFLKDPVDGTIKIFDKGELIKTGIAINPEELKSMRYVYGLDDHGKPLSVAQRIKTSPLYMQPVEITDEKEQPEQKTVKDHLTAQEGVDILSSAVSESPERIPLKQEKKLAPVEVPAAIKKTVKEVKITDAEPVVSPPQISIPVPKPPQRTAGLTPKPSVQVSKLQSTASVTPHAKPFMPPVQHAEHKKEEIAHLTPVIPKPTHRTRQREIHPQIDYMIVARRVLNAHKLLFDTLDVEKRFLSIITSYLKNVRDRIETREVLSRPIEEGGVNLAVNTIEDVLHTADEYYKNAKQSTSATAPAKKTQQQHSFVPTLDIVQKQIEHSIESTTKAHGSQPELVEDIFANVNPVVPGLGAVPVATSLPESRSRGRRRTPVITDIISTSTGRLDHPLVMGPIDELRNMNAVEFRRLSSNPQEAAKKIIQKLSLLEQESLIKKAEGIDAWHSSPLNKVYLQIGSTSLEKTISVGEAINHLRQQKHDTITEEEFEAIADLNRQIRY